MLLSKAALLHLTGNFEKPDSAQMRYRAFLVSRQAVLPDPLQVNANLFQTDL